MKKIICLLIVAASFTSAFSQNTTKIAKAFILERESEFNKTQAPKQIDNIDSLITKIKTGNVSYSITTYSVSIDSNKVQYLLNVASKTVIRNTKKPFIYFNISKMNGKYLITTVTGSDAL